jgi:hypothetical protein
MFAGCQQDVEYREVPGPTVTLPGNDTVTPGPNVPGKDVYVTADITVNTPRGLREALSNPDYDVIAVANGITLVNNSFPSWDRGDLVIPSGKTLYLYNRLEAGVVTPPITIDVQGDLVIGYGGTLSAGVEHQVKVSAGGSIKVQDTGVLETDVPASVNDGAATVLGTPQVLIDGYGKDYPELNPAEPVGKPFMGPTLRYTNSVDQWAVIETAFDSYITQGILDLSSAYFKPSDLVKLVTERPASVGTKAFKAKALVDETATALTIPVNAYISTDSDSFIDVETLTVSGHLSTGPTLNTTGVFNKLTSFTIAGGGGILQTRSRFDSVIETDIALGGSLINDTAEFPLLTDLTVNGTMVLDAALFTNLVTLNITAGSYLRANGADFNSLRSLTIGDDAEFSTTSGVFTGLNTALTVNGTFTASAGRFGALDEELVVNGVLTVGGNEAFPQVTTLTVTGKGVLNFTSNSNHFQDLRNLTVENGARINLGSSAALVQVRDVTVRGLLAVPGATWDALQRVTVTETGEFKAAAGGADFVNVSDLTVNGIFEAPYGTFNAITSVEGAGTLVAGVVPVTSTSNNQAKLLYDSPLTSVSLGSTAADIFSDDVTVPTGKTRIFRGAAGSIPKKIFVEPGATLVIGNDTASLNGGGGQDATIEVSGTLRFTGANPGIVAMVMPINVKEGGALIFDGTVSSTMAADITVASGGTLAFNSQTAASPGGDITVNGTLVVGNRTVFTLGSTSTLTLTGTLNAGDLTAQGFVFPGGNDGGTLIINGDYTIGSTIQVKIASAQSTTTIRFQPNGYIRDAAAKSPWSLEGGNAVDLGKLVFTGTTNDTITLGGGQMTGGLTTLTPFGAGVVTLNDGAYLVAKPYTGSGQAIGLTLNRVIIDLTTAGKIVVEPGAKLNLNSATSSSVLGDAGVITTDRSDNTAGPYTGLVGGVPVVGNLSTYSNAAGVINGGAAGKTIDKDDTFGISVGNITVTNR